jgi:hypothetical protein
MTKYRVELSRQIQQSATLHLDAKDAETAMDDAMDIALDGEAIWHDDKDAEPHTVCVELVVPSETAQ